MMTLVFELELKMIVHQMEKFLSRMNYRQWSSSLHKVELFVDIKNSLLHCFQEEEEVDLPHCHYHLDC